MFVHIYHCTGDVRHGTPISHIQSISITVTVQETCGTAPAPRVWYASCESANGRWLVCGGSLWDFRMPTEAQEIRQFQDLYCLHLGVCTKYYACCAYYAYYYVYHAYYYVYHAYYTVTM